MGKHGLTVDNVAVSGTSAADWAKDPYAMANAVRKNPDCKYVWLTIGGNDAVPHFIDKDPWNETKPVMLADTKVFLDIFFDEFPNIKVVHFGYEVLNWESVNIICNGLGVALYSDYCPDPITLLCENQWYAKL